MKLVSICNIIRFVACFLWLIVSAEEEESSDEKSDGNSTTKSKFFISQDKMKWDDAKKVKRKADNFKSLTFLNNLEFHLRKLQPQHND